MPVTEQNIMSLSFIILFLKPFTKQEAGIMEAKTMQQCKSNEIFTPGKLLSTEKRYKLLFVVIKELTTEHANNL